MFDTPTSPRNYRQFEELIAGLAFADKPIANRNPEAKRIIVMHDARRQIQGEGASAGLLPCALHHFLAEPRTPDFVKEVIPFIIAEIVCLILITYIPAISMCVPRLIFGPGA